MQLSHARRAMSVRFDDPNLVSCAGLAPVMALTSRCGLATLLTERLRIVARGASNATAKILAVVMGGAGVITVRRTAALDLTPAARVVGLASPPGVPAQVGAGRGRAGWPMACRDAGERRLRLR